ncbi:MAG: hypothetical protein NC253_11300 [Ruminococcus sp.]|nr:hypothetical protein [Ruminococcus sp.]MCM1381790.1 hypothetical protein [Muribaculaceae bacterium]MCM1479449.1 hypothetical protein [Muribaculaceae bacterium]
MDFIKNHPSIAVSIVGFLAVLLDLVSGSFAALGLMTAVCLFAVALWAGILLIGINIASMILVANDKPIAGVLLSLPLGGLGALIGLTFNPSYEKETAVKVIFSVQFWVIVWAVFSFILFNFDYYSTGPLPG